MKKEYLGINKTPQSEPIPGREGEMVQNRAGGYVFKVMPEEQLKRFLIMGTDGGTYYATEKEITLENIRNVLNFLHKDARRTIEVTAQLSEQGRVLKNDVPIAVLALAWVEGYRKEVASVFNRVIRIPTHLFMFLDFLKEAQGGKLSTSTLLKKMISNWYIKDPQLPYHLLKYQQRRGWSHKDVLRLVHPKPTDDYVDSLFGFVIGNGKVPNDELVKAFLSLREARTEGQVINIIRNTRIPWEFIPSQWLASRDVWNALFPYLPATALVRLLGRLTALEVLKPFNDNTKRVHELLTNPDVVRKARLHPVQMGIAMYNYERGKSRNFEWDPVPSVLNDLEKAFMLSFRNVEPINQRMIVGIDISGSMFSPLESASGMNVVDAALLVALPLIKASPDALLIGFSTRYHLLNSHTWKELKREAKEKGRGGTDLTQPVSYALKKSIPVDTFVILSDEETWAGQRHSTEIIKEYRRKMGIPSKLIVGSMEPNGYSVKDPKDPLQFNVIGFDPNYVKIVSEITRLHLPTVNRNIDVDM